MGKSYSGTSSSSNERKAILRASGDHHSAESAEKTCRGSHQHPKFHANERQERTSSSYTQSGTPLNVVGLPSTVTRIASSLPSPSKGKMYRSFACT